MIGAGNQPPHPDLEDDDMPYSISAEDLTIAGGSSLSIVSALSPNALIVDDLDPFDNLYEQKSVDELLKLADENLLQAIETVDKEQIAMIGEDNFKKRSKDVLTKKMQEDLIKKTKFTMLSDPREQSVVTRAKVYVFSEQDLRFFIENIVKNS